VTASSVPFEHSAMWRDVQALTDNSLVHLDVEDLIEALLDRVQQQLRVDTATVLLLDGYGQELVATASRGLEEEVAQGVRLPLGRGFAGSVAARREPIQLASVDSSSVLNPILLERGIRSVVGVPMIAAGNLLGVLHVGSLRPRRFTENEVSLLQMAAERLALATQTRLAQLDRATTVALQRSLLPARQIEIHGFDAAARYVPGAQADVGGDWYDVFQLPSGHVGVVIGDVAGHGLRAAVVMGRIRSALRAYALETDDPADVLTRLDRKISIFEPGAMATAVYAVIAPGRDTMRLSIAGHPPPIIAMPGAPSRSVTVTPDMPLGTQAGRRRRITEATLPEGALMFLYTDGLVERRDAPMDAALAKLHGSVTAGPPESVCAHVMLTMIGDKPAADDVAILAIARSPQGV
jgi:phosphoserine phosphatase RsbU/P